MHFIEGDLSPAAPWEELADEEILAGLESLLEKHASFQAFLEETGRE